MVPYMALGVGGPGESSVTKTHDKVIQWNLLLMYLWIDDHTFSKMETGEARTQLTAGEKQRISVDARVDGGPICNSKKTHGVTYKIKDPSKSLFF